MAFRRQAKLPKRQQPDKTPYTTFNPHTRPLTERKWTTPYYQVASIDPASLNYCLRIERRYLDGRIITIALHKTSIVGVTDQQTMICTLYANLSRFLDQFRAMFLETHIIVVERQMLENYICGRIMQHTLSYFFEHLKDAPLLPIIVELSSQLKTKQLGAPKGLNKRQIKQWCIEKARELLVWRDDQIALSVIAHHKKKKDDFSDTVCMIEAVFSYWGLPVTVVPPGEDALGPRMVVVPGPPLLRVGGNIGGGAPQDPQIPPEAPKLKLISSTAAPSLIIKAPLVPSVPLGPSMIFTKPSVPSVPSTISTGPRLIITPTLPPRV